MAPMPATETAVTPQRLAELERLEALYERQKQRARTRQVTAQVPADLRQALCQAAAANGVTLSAYIRTILAESVAVKQTQGYAT
jgi:predicted DNA binding CopG/RHH family protein